MATTDELDDISRAYQPNLAAGDAMRNAAPRDYSELQRINPGSALRGYSRDYSGVQERLGGTGTPTPPGRIAALADATSAGTGAGAAPTAASAPSAQILRIADAAPRAVGQSVPVYEPPAALPAPEAASPISRLATTAANDATDVMPRAVGNGAAAAAGPLESAAMSTLRRAAPLIAPAIEGVQTARVAANPNSTISDVAVQGAEGAGRLGAMLAGANVGQKIGSVAGGYGRVVGGIVGGGLGYFGADKAMESAFGPSPIDRLAQQAVQPQSQSRTVPGANGSTVQVNADGSSQLATRPTEGPNTGGATGSWDTGAGAGRGMINPPMATPSTPAARTASAAGMGAPAATQGAAAAQPAANPFDGAVQIIRPGGETTMAVQGPTGMFEMDPGSYAVYRGAVAKNPALAQRLQMTDAGPLIDGVAVPANLLAAGDKSVNDYIATLTRTQTTGLSPAQQLALREQNLSHMLPADTALAANVGLGGGVPGGAPGVTGEDFLKTLPTPMQAQVKALATGRQPFPTGQIMRTPYGQNLLNAVSQFDPSFDAVNYGARASTRKDFTSGKAATSVNAMNTVAGHLESLSDAADKLGNTSIPMVNGVKNWLENSTGDPRVKQFDTTKKAVVDELTRVWRGNGGSEGDIKTWSSTLDAANSPQQLHGVIAQMGELIGSKINSMGEQYRQGMGTTGEPLQLLTPKAQKVFEKLQQRAGGEPASASGGREQATGASQPPRKFLGGKWYENDGKGWYEVQ
jgi:hypothetical protein